MTFEIDINPHSFVVFMTIAAGVSYIFFNSRTGFGVMKLMTLLFFIVPLAIIGNSLGHSIDLAVGAVIGILTAKRVTLFNPFTRIKGYLGLRRAIHKLNERLKEKEDRTNTQQQDQTASEEAVRRQEQAKQERERKRQSYQSQSNKKNDSQSDETYSNQKTSSSHQSKTQKPMVKTGLEKAYEVLGLTQTASYAEVKRTRSKLMSLYHPDKLAGLPEGRRKQAEEEAKSINLAWSVIKQSL